MEEGEGAKTPQILSQDDYPTNGTWRMQYHGHQQDVVFQES
jgi:hypothetical protein